MSSPKFFSLHISHFLWPLRSVDCGALKFSSLLVSPRYSLGLLSPLTWTVTVVISYLVSWFWSFLSKHYLGDYLILFIVRSESLRKVGHPCRPPELVAVPWREACTSHLCLWTCSCFLCMPAVLTQQTYLLRFDWNVWSYDLIRQHEAFVLFSTALHIMVISVCVTYRLAVNGIL